MICVCGNVRKLRSFEKERSSRRLPIKTRSTIRAASAPKPILAACRPDQFDGVAALAQASEGGPRRVREPAGGGNKLGEIRAIATLQQFDDLRDLGSAARRRWCRGDVVVGLSMPAGSETGSGFGLTEIGWFARCSPMLSEAVASSTAIAFAPEASVERIGLPDSSSRRQIGAPAFALISFKSPASRSLATSVCALGALWTRWPNQAMIIALRRSAQQHKLRVVEFDGHVWTLAFREPADPGPTLTRAPDRSDRRGEGFARCATDFADGHAHAHTLSFGVLQRWRASGCRFWCDSVCYARLGHPMPRECGVRNSGGDLDERRHARRPIAGRNAPPDGADRKAVRQALCTRAGRFTFRKDRRNGDWRVFGLRRDHR